MDGAIILAADASRIARANVHLVPEATIPTSETGTRHRTAERVARSIDVPVIAVSEAMATIAVYRNDRKHTIAADRLAASTARARRCRPCSASAPASTWRSATLTRSRSRTRSRCATSSPCCSRARWSCRIAEEIEGHLVELGSDGRLIHLQTGSWSPGSAESLQLVVLRDYSRRRQGIDDELALARRLPTAARWTCPRWVAASCTCPPSDDQPTSGWRRTGTASCTGCPAALRDPHRAAGRALRLAARRSSRPRRPSSSPSRASGRHGPHIKDGLARLVEASIFERYE